MTPQAIFRFFDPADATRESLYRVKRPQTLDELMSYTHLVLVHFTSSVFLDSIRRHGLTPDTAKERAIDDGVPSDHLSVYLSTHYERFYLERAVKHHGGEGMMVVVQVERAALLADESALSDMDRARHPPDTQLFLSLCFGACKHPGPITGEKIVGIYTAAGVLLTAEAGAAP